MSLRLPAGMRLLMLALVVAVSALSAVGFFADRVEQALQREAAATLAADWALEQGRPIPQQWVQWAEQAGLQHSLQVSFPTVLFVNDRPHLVQVKAVQANYPLRGELRLRATDGALLGQVTANGSAWLAPRLQRQLGDLQSLPLGETLLPVGGLVVDEPDLAGNLFQLAPRLLVSWQQVQSSGLLGPASRARYRLLVAGHKQDVADFAARIKPMLDESVRVILPGGGRPELNAAISRGKRFLALAALCASLLAGIAILLATRRFVATTLDAVAVLRTLGMTGPLVLWRYSRQLLMVTLVATSLGVVLGYLGQAGLMALLGGWLGSELPAASAGPAWVALAHALLLVVGFAVPALSALRRVPPLRVLRQDIGAPPLSTGLLILLALGAYGGLIYWQVQDPTLASAFSLGILLVLLAFAVLAGGLVWLLARVTAWWKLPMGVVALVRSPGLSALQLGGFGLAISVLLLLGVVRGDLMDTWRSSLPEQTPNYFLINIQPDQVSALTRDLSEMQIGGSGFYPTTRARLQRINQHLVQADDYASGRAQRLATREYSLGFANQLPPDNRLLQGRLWQAGEVGWSVEAGLAETLGIKVGDRLQFDVAGQSVAAPVLSVRQVSWDSFNVNFFVQGSPALLQGLPHALISSVYVSSQQEHLLLARLARDYPAVSAIAIGPLLQKVRTIIDRGALAIQGVFLFTLLAALLVGVAAVQVNRDQRASEVALLRTLGASRRQVWTLVLSEFVLIGMVAGTVAALASNLMGMQLAARLFDLSVGWSPALWLWGVLGGGLLIGLMGLAAVSGLLRTPPMQVLRG